MSLEVVRDLRQARAAAGPEEPVAFETDMLAGFVLARAAAGLSDANHPLGCGASEAVAGVVRRPVVGHRVRSAAGRAAN